MQASLTPPANETMSSPFERMQELAAAGVPFAVATVIRTQGSTPQVVGAKLILTGNESERPFGTLGGGCVEADAIDAARKVLAGEPGSVREHQLTEELAWDTGLVCGGTMWILAEAGSGPAWPPAVDGIDAIAAAAERRPRRAAGGVRVGLPSRRAHAAARRAGAGPGRRPDARARSARPAVTNAPATRPSSRCATAPRGSCRSTTRRSCSSSR